VNNIQNTPFFKAKNHDKINFFASYGKIDSSNNESFSMIKEEAMSVSKAKDALIKNIILPKEAMQTLENLEKLKEAHAIFEERNYEELPENIKEVPSFFQASIERPELSASTKETFARIGARARREFIEQQSARAFQYNIPFNIENVNFLELEQKIDEYEELLGKAREQGVSWDISEYDPVALSQAIDEQDCYYRQERSDLYAYFVQTRGLEA
jgi:hypothetical protein